MNAAQQFDRALARHPPRYAAMTQDGFDDLLADRETRIERRHWLLKNHRQPVAAEIAQDLVGHIKQIEAVETNRAGDLGRMFRQQAHDRERRHALAAAGFTDEAERRAIGEAEVDAVDRVRGSAVVAMEGDPQALDFDKWIRDHLLPAMAALIPSSMVSRTVMTAGFLRVGRNRRKCTQRSRLTCSRRSSSPSGSLWSSTRR